MRLLALLSLLCLLFCASCQKPSTYVAAYDFGTTERWNEGENVVFDFQTMPPTKPGEIKLNFRYFQEASDRKFKLKIKSVDPNNVYHIDSLNVTLVRGSGDGIRSMEVIIRKGIRWVNQGLHTITLTPDRTIEDMVSVGIEIDNSCQLSYGKR